MSGMATEKPIYVNAPLPPRTHEEVRKRAFRERKSKGQLVVEFVHAQLGITPKDEKKSK